MNIKLIRISAIWCPSCIVMDEIYKSVSKELNISLISYDYDFDEDIVKKYEPGHILPVLILERNDCEIKRIVGEKKKEEIISIIKEVL